MVAAGAADGHNRRAVLRHNVIDERGARALARLQPVGVAVDEVEHLDSGADGCALLGEEHALAERAAAWCGAHEIAVAVDAGDMRCAAAVARFACCHANRNLSRAVGGPRNG